MPAQALTFALPPWVRGGRGSHLGGRGETAEKEPFRGPLFSAPLRLCVGKTRHRASGARALPVRPGWAAKGRESDVIPSHKHRAMMVSPVGGVHKGPPNPFPPAPSNLSADGPEKATETALMQRPRQGGSGARGDAGQGGGVLLGARRVPAGCSRSRGSARDPATVSRPSGVSRDRRPILICARLRWPRLHAGWHRPNLRGPGSSHPRACSRTCPRPRSPSAPGGPRH